jgi:hypothetical protein
MFFGHYPSSCLYLKTPSCFFFKTERFGDRILSPSSGKTYSQLSPIDRGSSYLRTKITRKNAEGNLYFSKTGNWIQCVVFRIIILEGYASWALKIVTIYYFQMFFKIIYVEIVWIKSNDYLRSKTHVLNAKNLHFARVSATVTEYTC